jgi:hypothetical protein
VSEQPKISDEAVELAAKLLYERHHKYFGTFNEWTMRHWDAGPQHVNRQPWLDDARALLAAAYPLLRGPIVDECERDAALLLAAVIAQTGPIFVPNGAMAGSGALTLRMVQDDDGITFSIEEGTTDA